MKLKDKMTIDDLEIFYDELEKSSVPDAKLSYNLTHHETSWILKKAIKNNDINIINNLLVAGVKIDVINDLNQTPIHLAYHQQNFKAINLLFSYSNNCLNFTDKNGLGHFHIACASGNIKIVERFLKLGVDVNSRDQSDNSALHFAVNYCELEIAELILRHGADPSSRNSMLMTPLHWSCRLRNLEKKLKIHSLDGDSVEQTYNDLMAKSMVLTKTLVKFGSDVNSVDNFGNTPVFYIFKEFFSEGFGSKIHDCENKRKFDTELKKMQVRKVKFLLSNNASVAVVNFEGTTVLHLAVKITSDFEIVRLLLQRRADPNARDNDNETPLKISVSLLRLDLVELLIKHGADVSVVNFDGFYYNKDVLPCLETVQNLLKIIDLLMERGLQMSLQDNLGVLRFLVANNADGGYPTDENTRTKLKNLLELGEFS